MNTTIAAISTAVSASGIGIIRISGPEAMDVISRIYRSKGGKKKIKEVTTKYTWKFWGLVIGEITFIVIFILLFGLSIKALVQDIQINTYKYKSEGTVTVAEFYGKTWVSNGSDSGSSSKFSYMHYVIHFDKKVGGYDQYEYSASNVIATERYLGDRYVVLFNNNVDNAKIIQKEDIFIDNVILVIFITLMIILFLLRKKIYLGFISLNKKQDKFIYN